jgi:glycogen synthase
MKIGYFTQFPYKNNVTDELIISSAGGVGVVAYNLAIQLAKRSHEVYIFTSSFN